MYYPEKKAKRFGAAVLVASILAILFILSHGNPGAGDARPNGIDGANPVVSTQAQANAVAANAKASKTKVAYGTSKYPSLSSPDADTYRKLDYKEYDDEYTYFYDFRDTWYAGCDHYYDGKHTTELYNDVQGFWGIRASTDKNVLTYEAYTDVDNVTVKAVQFRTYDDAETIKLDATANKTHSCKTGNLKNGPYTLCVWFNYKHDDGTVETIGTWQTVYVSDGHGWFADNAYEANDQAMKSWLTENHDELVADDLFQAWVAKQGGNDFTKATSVSSIYYPFKSGTSRYPNDTSKWAGLAHEICPDEDTSDYVKAYQLYKWLQSNVAYDKDIMATESDYRWATAAASGTAKGYTMWDSHLGMCEDFSNVYAIMCRELGLPCHVVSTATHSYNAMYLNGRWELVDVNEGIRSAYVGTDNKAYIANAKAYWAKQKTGDAYKLYSDAFCINVYGKLKVASYETSQYKGIEDKISKALQPLNKSLFDSAYYAKWSGTIYGH